VRWELSFKYFLREIHVSKGLKCIASIKAEFAVSLLICADMQRYRIETRVNRNVFDCLGVWQIASVSVSP
jgi:hypothetical protein